MANGLKEETVIDCIECGHPFDPADSTSPETCRECVTFTEWFFSLTPTAREEVARDERV